jgi:predicted transcriptional regulator
MFKNFMINELGITKEDIREWVENSCKKEAHALVEERYHAFRIGDTLLKEARSVLGKMVTDEVARQVASEVMKNVRITVDKKDE